MVKAVQGMRRDSRLQYLLTGHHWEDIILRHNTDAVLLMWAWFSADIILWVMWSAVQDTTAQNKYCLVCRGRHLQVTQIFPLSPFGFHYSFLESVHSSSSKEWECFSLLFCFWFLKAALLFMSYIRSLPLLIKTSPGVMPTGANTSFVNGKVHRYLICLITIYRSKAKR